MTYVMPGKTMVYGPGDFFFESGDVAHTVYNKDLCAAVSSVVGTAARRGVDAYHAILAVLAGRTVLAPRADA